MWYFSWILGMSLACTFSILNALWYEIGQRSKNRASYKTKKVV